jgi:hypothetical protein
VPLEAYEDISHLRGSSQLGKGVCQRVLVLQSEQRRQLRQIQFFDTLLDVLAQNEVDERALLVGKL